MSDYGGQWVLAKEQEELCEHGKFYDKCSLCSQLDNDGPAGDFLNDYWFTAGGPDEPPPWEMGDQE